MVGGMDWLPNDLQLRDLVALAALLISGSVWVRSRVNDKRDLFLKVHEQLLHPDLVDARRILYDLTSVEDVENLSTDDRTKLYRLFAMYDLMARYGKRGWIDDTTVLDEWADSLIRSIEPGSHFIEYRKRVTDVTWPNYLDLAELALILREKGWVDPPRKGGWPPNPRSSD